MNGSKARRLRDKLDSSLSIIPPPGHAKSVSVASLVVLFLPTFKPTFTAIVRAALLSPGFFQQHPGGLLVSSLEPSAVCSPLDNQKICLKTPRDHKPSDSLVLGDGAT